MRKVVVVALLLIAMALQPASAYAWGGAAHKYIMGRAIELLPAPLKPLFERHRDEIVLRVIDPDLWRLVGWEEDPNHFLDFGVEEYGKYPFDALPREYGAAIEKFGIAAVRKNGTLPWREAEMFGNLRRTFESIGRDGPFAADNAVLFAAVVAHYIQDAHQPLHATNNYDGQMTGQTGVHSRFETQLFERYGSRMTINPAEMKPISNPRDAVFDTLLASYQLVERVLAADKAAIGSKDAYDDEYFDKFFAAVKPIIEGRIAESISATAAMITGAWQQAGRPVPKLDMPRTVQKVKR